MSQTIKILGISGSLKATSTNTRLLQAAGRFLNGRASFSLFEGIGGLPFFNPDNEQGNEAVLAFKQSLREADGVVICTPEYAFGVPGVLKNALDWTVHTGDLNDKPVVALSCSPLYGGGNKAMASLLLTLGALGAKMDASSSYSIGDAYKKMDAQGQIADEETAEKVRLLVERLLVES